MIFFSEAEIIEARQVFRDLVRIDTTNPPGNELAACRYLAPLFSSVGLEPKIIESEPGRGNIVVRLGGDGTLKPLLLTSHLDVVPVERDQWDVDPFAAVEKEGVLWGRGTVDMKNMTALALSVILKAKREKWPLKRDIIFAAVADEEEGCRWGSQFLVEKYPDLIRAEYALNEVGGFSLTVDDKVFYPIGVAEKGVCWFRIIAQGQAGHGAMPHDDQAIGHVCFAAHRLSTASLPYHRTRVASAFIRSLAAQLSPVKSLLLKGLLYAPLSRLILNKLMPKSNAKNFHNLLHNLATPTLISAGYKTNVIPSEASVTIDGRILPEHTVAGFLDEVQKLIGPRYKIEVLRAEEANETDYSDPFYKLLGEKLQQHDPAAIPVPFLIPGYTDAKQFSRLGIKCFGFVPLKLPADLPFGELYHGHNERLPLSAFDFGLKVLADVVKTACCENYFS